MPKQSRLTNNSDETEIAALISGDSIFCIPYFQRAYKWKTERLRQLNKDILNVVDDEGFHFLGAVIVHGRRSNPSDPDLYDVIDGQQRLTTLGRHMGKARADVFDVFVERDTEGGFYVEFMGLPHETDGLGVRVQDTGQDLVILG